jgi:hypothetical protein
MQFSKIIFVIGILTSLAIFFVQCVSGNSSGNDPRGAVYAGSKVCANCHKDIAASYEHTNHYKTSGEVNNDSLAKWAVASSKAIYYGDSSFVKVEEEHSSFFQSHIKNGKTVQSEKFAITIGSAEKAQTYGYWKDGQLFQLPLTYFAGIHSWTNSPGFPVAQAYFNRVILSRCFECHASYVEKTDIQTGPLQLSEKLIPASFVYGIDCERCHGPAAEHVQFHKENPTVKEAKHIVSINLLTRQQQLDLCASCHSGNDLDVQRTLFAFRPGDTLANFYFPHFGSGGKEPDVHGKQMQLLQASKCFQQSNMTCASCHTPHQPEVKQHEVYAAKCMNCHQQGEHVLQMKAGNKTCVNCHMPLQESKKLVFNNGTEAKRIPYYLRTHRIAVYPDSQNLNH